MTAVEVAYRYGNVPGPMEMRAIDSLRNVYGIRRILFNEKEKTVRVEYDATRLQQNVVAALLRRAGIDLGEELASA
ncbi:MAG: hypothetical protein LAN70_08125 [Acidobacteriia bacterium]|nr:hypothetical protein [Terriglobia bacterium]